jgi:hypothetical protein
MKLIYADTNDYDGNGHLVIMGRGTERDLAKYGIILENGMKLTFYMDDADDEGNPDNLIFDGIVHFDETNQQWVAAIDWDNFKHASDFSKSDLERLGED